MNDSDSSVAANVDSGLVSRVAGSIRGWAMGSIAAWDQFWFTPRLPHMAAVLRLLTGLMLLYGHLVLATDLMSFVGDDAWVNNQTAREFHDGAFGYSDWGRSYLWYLSNPLVLWLHQVFAIVVTACFAAGLFTRLTGPLAWFVQLMFLHRLTGALFGLDQIVTYAAMYLMLTPCGSWLSVDAWIRRRFADRITTSPRLAWMFPAATASIAVNVATRLLQLHLCVIYLFGGLAKARGTTWWDGTAMWYAAGNYEYQSLDLTWIANFPRLAAALSHLTVFWELSYVALVWPRITRPIVLGIAFAVHGGIAIFLGMITFGSMMIAANLIFVRPEFLLRMIGRPVTDDRSSSDWDDIDAESDEVWSDEDLGLDELAEKSSIGLGSSLDLGSSLSALDQSGLDPSGLDIGSELAPDQGSGMDGPAGTDSGSLAERTAKLDRYERKLRRAANKLQSKSNRIKGLEEKYRQRVAKLKQREAKIKGLVDRKRGKNQDGSPE
ncbi:hypothetical protein K227x_11530 [Rubripirellula lacrimiformis]|uniref:HTTM-like domain-containing protein n=1 Tax=Rubripirellula lacrimiformis TaxID=1930273 RepID=A0A517N6M7_9BACT|nr:HTTM domain-containing protein [Rubripirellula lacrimiformis]QDT02775.1 hypothetical protein K227x_11530 [Rubripirellula lacrimiformis]